MLTTRRTQVYQPPTLELFILIKKKKSLLVTVITMVIHFLPDKLYLIVCLQNVSFCNYNIARIPDCLSDFFKHAIPTDPLSLFLSSPALIGTTKGREPAVNAPCYRQRFVFSRDSGLGERTAGSFIRALFVWKCL